MLASKGSPRRGRQHPAARLPVGLRRSRRWSLIVAAIIWAHHAFLWGQTARWSRRWCAAVLAKLFMIPCPASMCPLAFAAGWKTGTPTSYGLTGATMTRALADLCRLIPQTTRAETATLYDYCVDDPINRHDASGLAWDESKHPRDADGQFTTAGDDVSGYSTKGQELRVPVSREVMFRADIGRKAMSEREELKRSAISRNGMMRREEVWPRDKPLPKWDLDAAIARLQNAALNIQRVSAVNMSTRPSMQAESLSTHHTTLMGIVLAGMAPFCVMQGLGR